MNNRQQPMKTTTWIESASLSQTSPFPSFVRRGAGGGRKTLPKKELLEKRKTMVQVMSRDIACGLQG
jgi:hypothetical protein